jgi:hypothetical protein
LAGAASLHSRKNKFAGSLTRRTSIASALQGAERMLAFSASKDARETTSESHHQQRQRRQ